MTKEEYLAKVKEFKIEDFKKEFEEFALKQINKYSYIQKYF